ncbi:MAG TPA: clostripain-related cysteine peptidase [Pyrinomonadaceae bacterium]|nr:clostripain-related cysteine peptidase [Pyrinomonadaceae bacterium]
MPELKEWTLMFYFASDNPLAPGIVSQLKSLKAAGYHPDANVVTQFDPYTEGTPTHIFDVNLLNKLKHPGIVNVGFQGNDPFVRNLIEDKLWRDQSTRKGELVRVALKKLLQEQREIIYMAPVPPNDQLTSHLKLREPMEEPDPQESLKSFLDFCRTRYPARHYALFILGHGVVVGNDVFLYDEHASKQSVTLTELGLAMREFKKDVELEDAEFEFVSFHSCSVSSLEVAYELKETAKYMLASQGPAFVGSWPYRSILIRIFNDLVRFGSNIDVKQMLLRIYHYCLHNSADYLLAGYSFQLTLCNLQKVENIKSPIEKLAKALKDGLADLATRDVIQLAHLKSQSFYQELYSDLYDFCFCVSAKIDELRGRTCQCANVRCSHATPPMRDLYLACGEVMDMLVKEEPPRCGVDPKEEKLIISSEFVGYQYQYSHGLSILFPWIRPVADRRILAEYREYKFTREFADSWLEFLDAYFEETMREPSSEEHDRRRIPRKLSAQEETEQALFEDIANLVCGAGLPLDAYELQGNKIGPKDPTGDTGECAKIKNFPRDTRPRNVRLQRALKEDKKRKLPGQFSEDLLRFL